MRSTWLSICCQHNKANLSIGNTTRVLALAASQIRYAGIYHIFPCYVLDPERTMCRYTPVFGYLSSSRSGADFLLSMTTTFLCCCFVKPYESSSPHLLQMIQRVDGLVLVYIILNSSVLTPPRVHAELGATCRATHMLLSLHHPPRSRE